MSARTRRSATAIRDAYRATEYDETKFPAIATAALREAAIPSRVGLDEVWEALRSIDHGKTISYAELARRVGRPRAARAVGAANGANPISLVIPCHRVIGADGSLTGYGGGMERKQALLEHEGALAANIARPGLRAR